MSRDDWTRTPILIGFTNARIQYVLYIVTSWNDVLCSWRLGSRSYAACFLVVMLDSFDNARQQQEEEWRSFHLLLRRRPAFCITRENRFGPRQRRADIILASDDVEIERDRRIDLFVAFIKK